MDIFFKAVAVTMITVILGVMLSRQEKDFTLLITLCACCMIVIASFYFLAPILTFAKKLGNMLQISTDVVGVLIKAVGIGLIAEIASLLCSDAGNAALGKVIQYLSSSVILWLSIPLLEKIVTLIDKLLGGL